MKYTKQRVQTSSRYQDNRSLYHHNRQPIHQKTRGISLQIITKPITELFKRASHSLLKKQALKRPNNRFRKTAPVNYKLIALALAIVISGIFLIGDNDDVPPTTEQETVTSNQSELSEPHREQSLEMPNETLTTETTISEQQTIAPLDPDPVTLADETEAVLVPSPTTTPIISSTPTSQFEEAENLPPITTGSEQNPVSADTIRQEHWILQQNPKEYTLQLLATINETSLIDFIKKHNIQAEVAYYRSKKSGKTWYSLVYGTYNTYSLAQQTVQELPPKLKKLKPWVRNFSQIQKRIK